MKAEKQGQYCTTVVEMTFTKELRFEAVAAATFTAPGSLLPKQMAALREHRQHLLDAVKGMDELIETFQGVIDKIEKL